jgi:hypothetical protein
MRRIYRWENTAKNLARIKLSTIQELIRIQQIKNVRSFLSFTNHIWKSKKSMDLKICLRRCWNTEWTIYHNVFKKKELVRMKAIMMTKTRKYSKRLTRMTQEVCTNISWMIKHLNTMIMKFHILSRKPYLVRILRLLNQWVLKMATLLGEEFSTL